MALQQDLRGMTVTNTVPEESTPGDLLLAP